MLTSVLCSGLLADCGARGEENIGMLSKLRSTVKNVERRSENKLFGSKRNFMSALLYPNLSGHEASRSGIARLVSVGANGVDAPACVVNNAWSMSQKLSGKRLAVLGTGKLGGILLRGYLERGVFAPWRVTGTGKHAEKAASLAKGRGVPAATATPQARHGTAM